MLSLLRWTDLRWDFKEVLADLFCIIAVGLADEPDGIRQQHILSYGTFHKIVNEQIVDTNGSGHGALAGFLQAVKADALICGGIGMGAQTALSDAGIKLYAGVQGSADAAAKALADGTLKYDPEAKCDHHDHHHGEGHECGHHHGEGHECGHHHGDEGCRHHHSEDHECGHHHGKGLDCGHEEGDEGCRRHHGE